jgi:hypothetical protein
VLFKHSVIEGEFNSPKSSFLIWIVMQFNSILLLDVDICAFISVVSVLILVPMLSYHLLPAFPRSIL